jgi:hypothetical protein
VSAVARGDDLAALPLATGHVPFELGARRQHAAKQRVATEREVVRLLDALAPSVAPARRRTGAVQAYRWPNRCILQGASRAISISWFPDDQDDAAFGELLVISWQGTVSLPGSSGQRGDEAVAGAELVLHLEATALGGWTWHGATDDTDGVDTTTLAEYCRHELEPAVGAA